MEFVLILLWFFALLVFIPSAVYGIEIAMSFVGKRRADVMLDRPSTVIIVPAHNEETGIEETVLGIRQQMRAGDMLLVVADNCSDRTADVARAAGATVIERQNDQLRGKGYALDAGLRAIEKDPAPFVVFIDADCFLKEGALDALVATSKARDGAVQGVNLMIAAPGADIKTRIAEFAFLIKNKVRPVGMARLGLGCQLTGSAMALPWPLIQTAAVANGNLVEDMKLGLDLAAMGRHPTFCETSEVYSYFPHTQLGKTTQRRRWEGGHIALIAKALRSLATPGILTHPKSILFVFDLVIPPLSLLLMILVVATLAMLGLTLLLDLPAGPLLLTVFSLVWFLTMTMIAWLRHGTTILPLRSVIQIVPYILGKAPLYLATFRGRQASAWIRTDRTKESDKL